MARRVRTLSYMSATSSAGVPLPYLAPQRRAAPRCPAPTGAPPGAPGRPRRAWYPSHDEDAAAGSGGPARPRPGPAARAAPAGPGRRGPRPRWGRIALVAGVAVLVLALLGGRRRLAATPSNLNDDLDRTDPFSEITGGRPAKTVDGALNILLVGSDSRDPDAPVDRPGKWRADTMIVMHIPADHKTGLPGLDPARPVRADPGERRRGLRHRQRAKINAAFAFGGLPLAVQTVECFTDVRIDHVVAIDFGGFKEVTDALGGVDLKVEQTITSIHKPYRKFNKGTNAHGRRRGAGLDPAAQAVPRRRLRPDAAPAGVPARR